jgi:hypothetical protein
MIQEVFLGRLMVYIFLRCFILGLPATKGRRFSPQLTQNLGNLVYASEVRVHRSLAFFAMRFVRRGIAVL